MKSKSEMFPATTMPDRNWWHALWPDPQQVIRELRIKPGMIVVDVGCGYGFFTVAIARQVGHGHVIGLDLDPDLLAQAKMACREMDNCEWLLEDAMNLSSLAIGKVDYVLIANTFHGVPNKVKFVEAVATILKPNGRFTIVNWHALPREKTTVLDQPRGPNTELRLSPEQTQEIVEPIGFKLDTVVELPPYHYGSIFTRTK